MTAFQSEIALIIRRFSAKEREIFAQHGGSTSAIPAPEPEWFKPGVDKLDGFHRHVTHNRYQANLVTVLIAGDEFTMREAAELLRLRESVLRNRLNRADEIEVNGVAVKRATPKRSHGEAA